MIRRQEAFGERDTRVTEDTAKEVLCMLPPYPARVRKADIAADMGCNTYGVDGALDRIRSRFGIGVLDYMGEVCIAPRDWSRARQIGQWHWDETRNTEDANA